MRVHEVPSARKVIVADNVLAVTWTLVRVKKESEAAMSIPTRVPNGRKDREVADELRPEGGCDKNVIDEVKLCLLETNDACVGVADEVANGISMHRAVESSDVPTDNVNVLVHDLGDSECSAL